MGKSIKKILVTVLIILFILYIFPLSENVCANKRLLLVQKERLNNCKVEDIMKDMSIKEKVGQLFIISLRELESAETCTALNDELKMILQKYKPGGIILFEENIVNIDQTVKLINDMQGQNRINMFISIDEEGGKVSRLSKSEDMHSTKFMDNINLGKINDIDLAKNVGSVIGKELFCLGFNMNFAPVADVNTNPENPVIGDRAFSDDPVVVSNMVIAQMDAMEEENIISVVKHFPGHGDTNLDSHKNAVAITHGISRLNEIELVPFKKAIDNNVKAIMTSHIQTPNITQNNLPVTMSKEFLIDILRDELNYDNLIITDALEMKAISSYWNSKDAAIIAFKAGVDILLLPVSIEEAYNGLLNAVECGEISQERLDESVGRILKIKLEYNILKSKEYFQNPHDILGNKNHIDVLNEYLKRLEDYEEKVQEQ